MQEVSPLAFFFTDCRMFELIKIKKKNFYTTIISIAAIILAVSAETLAKANNNALFEIWLTDNGFKLADEAQMYGVYLSATIFEYFLRLIVPFVYGLQTYFAYVKTGVGAVYKAIWAVILGAMLVITFLNFEIESFAYYVSAAAYVIIIISLLLIKKDPKKDIGG